MEEFNFRCSLPPDVDGGWKTKIYLWIGLIVCSYYEVLFEYECDKWGRKLVAIM